ncbi:MAG: DGQHR domain-containing protein [Gammaproteobacteria bacterium AqS3]|nr:DGQHR domain-containing protein [Gammaproteobacteria bacterium AqS3]
MPTTVPAMKGKMGDINYYVISMKAGEVIQTLKIPKDMPGWDNLTIDEKYQRDINYRRVRDHIAPYLASNPSRFFGALIVTVMNSNGPLNFRALNDDAFAGELRSDYQSASDNIGFLTFQGREVIVPLDGQHRLKALEFAITGLDNQGNPIPGIRKPCIELASEDIVLILVDPIKNKTEKIRRIFTRINLTARRPTTGENIVTNDDDIIAVLARDIASNEIEKGVRIGADLVKFKDNTLRKQDPYFTTLAIIYNINEAIIKAYFPPPDITRLPDSEKADEYEEQCKKIWAFLLKNIETFQLMLSDLESDGDELRCQIRQSNLLGKPVGQECLFKAFLKLTNGSGGFSWKEAAKRLNQLPWLINDENISGYWENVLWSGTAESGRIITKNRILTTLLIMHLAGGVLPDEEKQKLKEDFAALFPSDDRPLPDPVIQ